MIQPQVETIDWKIKFGTAKELPACLISQVRKGGKEPDEVQLPKLPPLPHQVTPVTFMCKIQKY